MLTILIADDHPIVRRAMREILETQPTWRVCAETDDGAKVLDLALEHRPHVAIIDVSLPTLNGVAATARLKRALPTVEVLLFTVHDDDQTIEAGLAAGARGYLLKSEADHCLLAAVSALATHRSYFSPSVHDLLLETAVHLKKPRNERLSGRELEVVQLIVEGQSNKRIARQLAISLKTVESHRGSALRKAGVHTAAELVRFAIKNHLVQT